MQVFDGSFGGVGFDDPFALAKLSVNILSTQFGHIDFKA